jgi:hypothetical protein
MQTTIVSEQTLLETFLPRFREMVREELALQKQEAYQEKELWSYQDVAEYLGKSVATITRYKQQGKIPATCFRKDSKKVIWFFPEKIKELFNTKTIQ